MRGGSIAAFVVRSPDSDSVAAGRADTTGAPGERRPGARSAVDVSVVVPLFNEEESLPVLGAEIRAALEGAVGTWEAVFVDDGSLDASLEVLRRLAAEDPRVKVLRLRRNCGQSAALAAGIGRAAGKVIVTLDADLQNDPADIPRLLEALGGYDVVSGVRRDRRDDWRRRAASRIANAVRSRVLGDRITDMGCSLKAYRAEFLRGVPMFDGVHRFLPVLAESEGARVREIKVAHRPRRFGKAKYNIANRAWRALADLLAVRWMRKRWIDRGLIEEVTGWSTKPSGSGSGSADRRSSSAAS